jgi:predicted ATPase
MEKFTYTLEDLRGVGRVELELRPKERAYVFFGVNGVGKTKCLEGVFQYYLFTNSLFFYYKSPIYDADVFFSKVYSIDNHIINTKNGSPLFDPNENGVKDHKSPVIFIGAGKRGHLDKIEVNSELFGTFEVRQERYFKNLIEGMKKDFSSLGMDMELEKWIVTIAHAANPFQAQEDNRRIEIDTLLQLLNQVDSRFDPVFLTIDGNNHVSIKVNGVITKIRDLSTGFASLLKIFQTIISGYGFFTNSTNLANVAGIVFIDEIESHLHVEWQSKIIPLLKKLFPNTTFYIATHSPIVLSQLEEGEAYRLEKQADGVVRATIIEAPNKRILSDVLVDAMDVDLNALKRKRLVTEDQTEAKKGLLALLRASKAARQKEPA